MRSIIKRLAILAALCAPLLLSAEPALTPEDSNVDASIDNLSEPLYSPFIERYMLDEIRSLRIDMERSHREMAAEVVDRELGAADKAVSYATNTVTYFFYLIAAVSSALVLIGWNSIRDIKDKVHKVANEQVAAGKIAIYDHILALRKDDIEAITYKADAALDQNEPQWAINLCHQALVLDDANAHAFYQLACAHTCQGNLDDAARYFTHAVAQAESYREELHRDPALSELREHPLLIELLAPNTAPA